MLTHYLAYMFVGAFYYMWLASFSAVAAGIGSMPILAFVGSILLTGLAAPLAILRHRFAYRAAVAALALLLPWVCLLAVSIVRSPSDPSLLAIPAAAPGILVLVLGVRAIRESPVPRLSIPRALQFALAAPPAGVAIAIVTSIGWRLAGGGAV